MTKNVCPINVAWHRLQAGTLRVDLDTCQVYSRVAGQWQPIRFLATTKRGQHAGGYLCAKLQATIDGVTYRQQSCLHRIVWMAKHGQQLFANDHVDHGKAGRACNHWSNLERVTPQENNRRRWSANPYAEAA